MKKAQNIQSFLSLLIKLCPLLACFGHLGCGLKSGQGWTEIETHMTVSWDAQGRFQSDNFLKTAKNYRIDIENFGLYIANLTYETSSANLSNIFDPANPPPGYSLCHNGHCHADSGELVDYETIMLETDASTATSKSVVQIVDAFVEFDGSQEIAKQEIILGACNDLRNTCEIGPDNMKSVAMNLQNLRLHARVYHDEKLPQEGIPISIESTDSVSILKLHPVALGSDADKILKLKLQLTLGALIWDAIEFSEFLCNDNEFSPAQLSDKLTESVRHKATIEINH